MINLNGQLLPALPDNLLNIQRAAFYGDGVFETIRAFSGMMPFWDLHWNRLQRGIRALEMDWPAAWTSSHMAGEIKKAALGNSRIRWMVWRDSGGLYLPESRKINYLIHFQPLETSLFEWKDTGVEARFCHSVKLPVDDLSGLKLLGGTRYVKAALECRKMGAEEGLLFNGEGRICEAVSSNLFWIKDGYLYYPSSGEGQVAGTIQKYLIELAEQNGWHTLPRHCFTSDLEEADEVFLTNAIQGIRWVRMLEGKTYGYTHTKKMYDLLCEGLGRCLAEPFPPLAAFVR